METENVPDQPENIPVSSGLQYGMDRCGTDQLKIRDDGSVV